MVASLVAVRLFDEWFSFLPAGSLEPLRIDLDLTYEQLSLLLVLMTVGGLAGGVTAVAADRVSRRAQASLGALGYAASMACWGFGHRFWLLAVGALLLGLSSDALVSACEVALVDLANTATWSPCWRRGTWQPAWATSSARSCWRSPPPRAGRGVRRSSRVPPCCWRTRSSWPSSRCPAPPWATTRRRRGPTSGPASATAGCGSWASSRSCRTPWTSPSSGSPSPT